MALLQTLVRAGRLTQDSARAFAQALEQRRAAGERPSLVDALVARRVATPEEIARALKTPSDRVQAGVGAGRGGPPPPFAPDTESPTIRVGPSLPRPESFINVPGSDTNERGRPVARPGARPGTDPGPSFPPPGGNFAGTARTGFTRPPFPSFSPAPESRPGALDGDAVTVPDPADTRGGTSPGGWETAALGTSPHGTQGTSPWDSAPAPAGAVGGFVLETKVGDGTLGEVWKAKQTKQRRTVAVKVFRASSVPPSELERLLAEARTASRVRHPNIVAVHEVGKLPDGRAFVAMDFVDGSTLAQTLEARTLGAAEVARIGAKIASALQAAHEQGIVHGDVKPANILLDDRSEPFIADFGLAREDGEEKPGGLRFRGTPGFLAPEQVSASPTPTAQSDVFSLGATLYCCLTRKPPFAGETPLAQARAALKGRPTRPTKLEPTVPPELEAVVMKALERDPERRYANAAMLGEDLRRFLDGRPLEAKPVGAFSGGSGVLLAALAALVVVLGGALAVLVARKVQLEKHVHELEDLEAKGEFAELEARARALAQDRPDEPRAERYLAYAYVGEHKLPEAVDAATKAKELSGEAPDDLVALGIASLAADKQDEARSAFEKALAKKPLAPRTEARATAGSACVDALASTPGATDKAAKALDLAPDDPDVLALAGRALLVGKDATRALDALKKAVAARPKDENVLTDQALAVAATGDASGALADLDQTLADHPEHVPALVARARLKLATGENQGAADDADKARTLDPSSRDAQLLAAIAFTWQSRLDDADARVQELMKLAPAAPTTAIARALLSLARGKPDDAHITLRDVALPRREQGLLVVALRAIALEAAGRPEEARNEADQLAKAGASPDASWLTPAEDDGLVGAFKRRYGFGSPESTGHALEAEALYQLHRLADAKTELEAAKRAMPPAPRASLAEGLLQLASNDATSALHTADAAIQACPDLAALRELRAQVRIRTNALALALSDADAAIKLEPKAWSYHFLCGEVRLMMGDGGAALTELNQADQLAPRIQPAICAARATILINTKRVAEGRKAAEKGLGVDEHDVECLYARGYARFFMGEERYDEDFLKALNTPQGAGRFEIWLALIDTLTARGRCEDADKASSAAIERLAQTPGMEGQQAEQLKLNLVFRRLQARLLVPDRWKDALDEANQLLAGSPDHPDLLGARGFVLAALKQEAFADDVKKVVTAPGKSLNQMLQRGMLAAQLKLPGDWTSFYSMLGELAPQKELKIACWKVLARAFTIRQQNEDAAAALKKILELAPDDEGAKRALESISSPDKK